MLNFASFQAAGYQALADDDGGVMLCKQITGTHLDRSTYQRYEIVIRTNNPDRSFSPEATLMLPGGRTMKVCLTTHHEIDTVVSVEAFYADIYDRLNCVPISG